MERKQTSNKIVQPPLNAQLRWQRKVRGWSLERVAEELDRLGGRTDSKQVGKWERGQVRPSPCYQEKLCQLYGANAEELGFCKPREGQAAGMLVQEGQTPTAPPEKRWSHRHWWKQQYEQKHLKSEKEALLEALSLFDDLLSPLPPSAEWTIGFLAGYVSSLRVSQRPQLTKEA